MAAYHVFLKWIVYMFQGTATTSWVRKSSWNTTWPSMNTPSCRSSSHYSARSGSEGRERLLTLFATQCSKDVKQIRQGLTWMSGMLLLLFSRTYLYTVIERTLEVARGVGVMGPALCFWEETIRFNDFISTKIAWSSYKWWICNFVSSRTTKLCTLITW